MPALPPGWDIAALIAAAVAIGGLLLHIMVWAYQMGRLVQRVTTLEVQHSAISDTRLIVAGLQATVQGFQQAIERLADTVDRMDGRHGGSR